MRFKTVEGHTFVPGIMKRGGYVLDVGCRGFEFSAHFASRGFKVLALDPDPAISDPGIRGVEFLPFALVHDDKQTTGYVAWEDLHWSPPTNGSLACEFDPRRSDPQPGRQTQLHDVRCINLRELMRLREVECFELVKLGCEGSEYSILRQWPGPISKQISAEFHDWAGANPADSRPFAPSDSPSLQSFYQDLFAYLEPWYEVVLHDTDALFDPEDDWRGYMDSVLVLKCVAGGMRAPERTWLADRMSRMARFVHELATRRARSASRPSNSR